MEVYLTPNPNQTDYNFGDSIVEISNVSTYSTLSTIIGSEIRKFNSSYGFVDLTNSKELDKDDIQYIENDNQTIGPDDYGDRLETVTVRNVGTLDDSEIESIALLQNGTEITNASQPTNGTWVLTPPADTGWFGPPGNGSEFEFRAQLADNATAGESVELWVPNVSDDGTAGRYDAGDTGLFFEQDSPVGDLGPGPTLTVEADSSSDGSGGSEEMPPNPELNVSLDLDDRNVTTDRETLPVAIRTTVTERSLVATLRNVTDNSTVASKEVLTNETGAASVAFPIREGRFRIRVRDPETDADAWTDPITVRSRQPARFRNSSLTAERGTVPSVWIELRDADRASLRVRDPTGKQIGTVAVEDDGDGLVQVDLDTRRLGHGSATTGFAVRDGSPVKTSGGEPGTNATGDEKNRSQPGRAAGDRSRPGNRTASNNGSGPGGNRSVPLGAGRYDLSLVHRGNVTDSAELRVTADWSGSVRTYVAPRGVDLGKFDAVRNRSTRRRQVALGDVLVVEIHTRGIDLYGNRSGSAGDDGRSGMPPGSEASVHSKGRGPGQAGRSLNLTPSKAAVSGRRGNDTYYLVMGPNQTRSPRIRPGQRYGASFALTERSPYVAGLRTPNETERESIGANLTFVEPVASFRNVSTNGTLDLPPANVTLGGETNVAPGTEATIHVEFNESNESLAEPTVVESDGTYEETVDLSEYEGGSAYTVSVTADGDRLSPVRSGHLVEESAGVQAAAGGGGAGDWGADSGSGETATATATGESELDGDTTTTVTTSPPSRFDVPSIDRLPEDPRDLVPKQLHVGPGAIAIGLLGLLALLALFVGIERLR